MNTSAPTIRALELENQRLKAKVVDLVWALRQVAIQTDASWAVKIAREAVFKHGA